MKAGSTRSAEPGGEQSVAKKACRAASKVVGKPVSKEAGPSDKFGEWWAIHARVWTGRVLMDRQSKRRGVIEYPGLHYKNNDHAATYFVMWDGQTESVETPWKDVDKWMTNRFCTTSPWVVKSFLAYQANDWHSLTAEVEKKFNLDKKKLLAERKLKQKIWRDTKNQLKSEKFREDPSTILTPSGQFFFLVEQNKRLAEEAEILASRDPNEIVNKKRGGSGKKKATDDNAGDAGCGGGSSGGGRAPAAAKRAKVAASGKAGGGGGVAGDQVKVEKGTESAAPAADGDDSEEEGSEAEQVDEEDAQLEWTEVCWTGHRYPKKLAFAAGDKTVAETLAEEAADRAEGKPEPEFVVESIMDEMRAEVEGNKKPVKYFLVKWEGYELDVQSGLDSETFGGSWLTESKLRGNDLAKAWKRSPPGWWLRQIK